MYFEELKEVIRSIKQKKNFVSTFENELFSAKTVISAEESSKKKQTIKIQ